MTDGPVIALAAAGDLGGRIAKGAGRARRKRSRHERPLAGSLPDWVYI